jgi:hypothetical protein
MRPLQWTPLSQEELAVLHGLYRTTKDARMRTRAQMILCVTAREYKSSCPRTMRFRAHNL